MVARMTRILLVLQLFFGIAIYFFAIDVMHLPRAWQAATLGVVVIVLVRMSITANSFILARLYRSETPPQFQLDWRQASQLFRTEFNASMLSSSWSMAFRSFDKRPATQPVGLPVLLIHGYGCNSGYWHWMSQRLKAAGISHHAVNLEPVLADIDSYVPQIQRAVEALIADSGQPRVILLAHSMGGLVSRAYLRDHGADRIAKIITLATPHRGTGLANHGAGENSRQMRRDVERDTASDWILRLEETENASIHALFVSIYSHHDNIVSPQNSSHLDGATNIELHGIGHVAIALDVTVQQCVIDQIHAVSNAASTT